MLAKTALLILSNPKQIGTILPNIQQQVRKTLYIQLLSALNEPFGHFYRNKFNTWPKYNQLVTGIYSQAVTHCRDLDVRVLLSGIKYQNLSKIHTNHCIELVIFDRIYNQNDINEFVRNRIDNVVKDFKILTLDSGEFSDFNVNRNDEAISQHICLGGTFDRLHVAHKLLLSEAALRAKLKLTVGVTDENMLKNKTLCELIEDIQIRIDNVRDFVTDICPELDYNIFKLPDPYGPSISDPTIDAIVVSEETVRTAIKINEIRQSRNLQQLKVIKINLIDEPDHRDIEENKISSSTTRIRLLGTVFNPIVPNEQIPKKPYVIGLTGGIASGKSGVAKWLSNLGATIINCDLIGHAIYKKGKPCYLKLIDYFGKTIIGSDGEIDRKILGGIVFKDSEKLQALNRLVWPSIIDEVNEIIRNVDNSVVVIEAAVLIQADWNKFCHEVWTTLVPREEAIKRLTQRNNLTEEQAIHRLDSQPTNSVYVKNSNVIFCPLWDEQFTKKQVEKAWELLQKRLPS